MIHYDLFHGSITLSTDDGKTITFADAKLHGCFPHELNSKHVKSFIIDFKLHQYEELLPHPKDIHYDPPQLSVKFTDNTELIVEAGQATLSESDKTQLEILEKEFLVKVEFE